MARKWNKGKYYKVKTNKFNFLSHLSRASSVARSSAVWKACKALCGDKIARRRMSKVVFVAALPHLNVDVHALFPGNLFKAQRLSDNIFQLELGLVSREGACTLCGMSGSSITLITFAEMRMSASATLLSYWGWHMVETTAWGSKIVSTPNLTYSYLFTSTCFILALILTWQV